MITISESLLNQALSPESEDVFKIVQMYKRDISKPFADQAACLIKIFAADVAFAVKNKNSSKVESEEVKIIANAFYNKLVEMAGNEVTT